MRQVVSSFGLSLSLSRIALPCFATPITADLIQFLFYYSAFYLLVSHIGHDWSDWYFLLFMSGREKGATEKREETVDFPTENLTIKCIMKELITKNAVQTKIFSSFENCSWMSMTSSSIPLWHINYRTHSQHIKLARYSFPSPDMPSYLTSC